MAPDPQGSASTDGDDATTCLPVSRRTLIRLLIVVAIGIPIVVEGITFVGLVSHQLTDGGDGVDGPADSRGVGIGDDLLPATAQAEALAGAVVDTTQGWEFTITVDVTNGGASGYRLALTSVTTDDGSTVTGRRSTGALPNGATTRLTAAWDLPDGEMPDTVVVEATVPTDSGTRTERAIVALDSVDVRG